jgi:hypothetical protein
MTLLAWLCFFVGFFSGLPEDDWVLQKEQDGIRIYTRKFGNKNFRQIKTVMQVPVSPEVMAAVIRDSEGAIHWVDRAKIFRDIKVVSPTEWYTYTEVEIPFPFRNKDIVTRNQLQTDEVAKTATVSIKSLPDFIPTQKGKDRIQKSEGTWTFRELKTNQTEITYLIFAEPDGILPQWIVTPLVVGSIFKTMKNLEQVCLKEKYKKGLD